MATKPKQAPKGAKPAQAPTQAPAAAAQQQPAAAPASPLPTPATPTPAAAPTQTVALRGGQAVAAVALTQANYRTAAPHNVAWWGAITKAIATGGGSAAVAPLLASQANPGGVPGHFVAYCLRRGYLQAVAPGYTPPAPAPAPAPAQQ